MYSIYYVPLTDTNYWTQNHSHPIMDTLAYLCCSSFSLAACTSLDSWWVRRESWLKDRFNLFSRFPLQSDVGGRTVIRLLDKSRMVRCARSVMLREISVTWLCERKRRSSDCIHVLAAPIGRSVSLLLDTSRWTYTRGGGHEDRWNKRIIIRNKY